MIVVCTSRRLEGPELRKVEGVFGARRGPDHALIRVEVAHSSAEIVVAVQRALEAFAANHGRIVRRMAPEQARCARS